MKHQVLGIVPTADVTYEVYGPISGGDFVEGKLYFNDKGELFYYTTKTTRPNPSTGWFPIWDGNRGYKSLYVKSRKYPKDVIKNDIQELSNSITKDKAEKIIEHSKSVEDTKILEPQIQDGDGMFTQCVKGIINKYHVTISDLYEMAKPAFTRAQIETYYTSLNKIKQMRLNKWDDWMRKILHLHYIMEVYKDKELVIKYEYPIAKVEVFHDGKDVTEEYKDIIDQKLDAFKTIIKILMKMYNLDKARLKSDQIDDYTVNNMMTTINADKPVSSQLFSRFMKMARAGFVITIYDIKDKEVFKYQEH